MTSLLLRQFTPQARLSFKQMWIRLYGIKRPQTLNQVIPDVNANLLNSSEQFIDSLVDFDSEFIEQITTPCLGKILLPEIAKLKEEQVKVRHERIESKLDIKDLPKDIDPSLSDQVRFSVSPYVIFGQSMEDRLKDENPWKNLTNIFSLNRFIYLKEGFNYQKLRDNQIFGFNCYYHNLSREIQVTRKLQKEKYRSRIFVISFETDATNHEFYVSDFNFLIRQNMLNQPL